MNRTDEGHLKFNIKSGNDYVGTFIDFHDELQLNTQWYVYIIQCEPMQGSRHEGTVYYTGKTWDLEKRFKEHLAGNGSQYMKKNKLRPQKVVYFERFSTEKEALKREQEIKKWSHGKKKKKGNEFLKRNVGYVDKHLSNEWD